MFLFGLWFPRRLLQWGSYSQDVAARSVFVVFIVYCEFPVHISYAFIRSKILMPSTS